MIFDRIIYNNVTIFDLLLALLIMLIAAMIGKIIAVNLKRVFKDISKDSASIISKVVYYTFVIAGVFTALPLLEVNLSGLLVAGGLMAIVIGFASQSIVTNLISGLFLSIEKPLRVEDVVNIGGGNGTVGMVEDIRIMSTTIRTFDGVYVRIPNEKVFTNNVTNYMQNVARRFEYVVGIRYSDDADDAVEIIKSLIEEHPLALKHPSPQIFVQNLGSSSVDIAVRIWAPSTQWFQVRMELLWKIKKTLEENDIKVPFNQQEVWFLNELETKKGGSFD
ncbi:MAG: mechanosensitive ion channel family protein [Thermoplasmata archaeon]